MGILLLAERFGAEASGPIYVGLLPVLNATSVVATLNFFPYVTELFSSIYLLLLSYSDLPTVAVVAAPRKDIKG